MTQSRQVAAPAQGGPENDNSNQGKETQKKQGIKNMKDKCILIFIGLVLGIVLTILYFSICLKGTETQHFCPHDWIGFQDKCYYFSKEEGDWNSSRYNCSTQHTDLTMIDTVEEMHFLRRHKCTSDHWIGLEMTENQIRKWVNGTVFNKWFTVRGNEKCAYLNDDGVATARCYTERKWICRKKVH
ncbi:C-type lectin domain family 2 member B [Equus asinus]|uniref:C-type lectin domain family 2 member B n=1 Tax=Equus asinus TaxID=9793 RepID=A0A8C4PQ40_EQUAS|nr:C-type lectin domain family 2 member B [Equus asinus]XP_044612165.1 C-type lectin domain family 2 member B [Equus asinus]